jgi:hypothetical protein
MGRVVVLFVLPVGKRKSVDYVPYGTSFRRMLLPGTSSGDGVSSQNSEA